MADFNTHTPPVIEHRVDASKMEEKQLHALLELQGTEEGFTVKKIQDNIFAVGWENTEYFCDKQGEVLVSPTFLRWNTSSEKLKEESKKLFQAVSWQAGYREERDLKTKIYTLYNIKTWEDKVVPKNTPEYFQAWKDVEFQYERWQIYVIGEKPPKDENDRLGVLKAIRSVATNWNLRIKDLLFLASPKMWYLKQSDFISLLPIVREHLLHQIGNVQWDRTLDPSRKPGGYPITKEEFDQYLKLNLIDQPLYNQAVKKLAEVEKLKQRKSEKSQEVMDSTKGKVEKIKP